MGARAGRDRQDVPAGLRKSRQPLEEGSGLRVPTVRQSDCVSLPSLSLPLGHPPREATQAESARTFTTGEQASRKRALSFPCQLPIFHTHHLPNSTQASYQLSHPCSCSFRESLA